MIAKGRRADALCSRIGPRHLMVAPDDLPAFRTTLLKLGCVPPLNGGFTPRARAAGRGHVLGAR